MPVSIVYIGKGALPLKLRAFLEFAGPRLKERLTTGKARCRGGRRYRPAMVKKRADLVNHGHFSLSSRAAADRAGSSAMLQRRLLKECR